MATIKQIVPHLWYDTQAIEAANFYVSVFPDSKINYTKTLPSPHTPTGSFDIVSFELSGNTFMAISAGPIFKLNESVSFMVYCDTQDEIDYYWEKLTAGGEEQPCGWLKDKYGLSWQIVSAAMDTIFKEADSDKINAVLNVVLTMKKIDLQKIKDAYQK
ncbi:MAG TPA: VOC family protein [Niabella sp.]|nr:VOC family protein [Niabella sp.]HOZ95887.1 VOC family protein [Niabella sp.]HQW15799.1 VOC family protein [Niabella sp.]HQX20939.1 VOC family protein [Niabella sp.]HQX41417.1 VOC family protein [Niabella sp.]